MQTVWKYELFHCRNILSLPKGAKSLSVHSQGDNKMYLWAMADPEHPTEPRKFMVIPTGGEVPPDGQYIGTIYLDSGRFVFHVFEFGFLDKP